MTQTEPINLELDYSLWRCGGYLEEARGADLALGEGDACLMQVTPPTPHSCCCVGLMLRAAGVPDAALVDREAALDLEPCFGELPERAQALLENFKQETGNGDAWVMTAYQINDQAEVLTPRRMARITRLCATHGIQLSWANVPESTREKFKEEMTS